LQYFTGGFTTKKLSIIVALILCVTIGGVYATWVYPGNEMGQVIQPVSNVMAEADFAGSFGTYHTVSNSLALQVDQASGSFNTELKYVGELVIEFTPHANISPNQKAAALGATVTVTAADLSKATYTDDQGTSEIWNLSDTPTFTLAESDWSDTDGDGIYTCTITCDKLNNIITMKRAFNLLSYDKYLSFQKQQKLAVFRIKIAAAAVASSN